MKFSSAIALALTMAATGAQTWAASKASRDVHGADDHGASTCGAGATIGPQP
jgi:hypothetical protein